MSSQWRTLDGLCRDPEDGAYHCPDCDAPFTRRSNLRRHFVIHMRNMPFTCPLCDDKFFRNDELQNHSCMDSFWHGLTGNEDSINPNVCPEEMTAVNGKTAPQNLNSSTSPPSGPSEVDQVYVDFMTCIASPAARLFSDFDSSLDQSGRLKGAMAANRTESTMTSTVNTDRVPGSRHRSGQPYNGGRRRKKLEEPIYTRRQVDDMLNAVSHCFAGTLEEVLKRCSASEKLNEKSQDSSQTMATLDESNPELRRILKGALLRLFDLESFLDER